MTEKEQRMQDCLFWIGYAMALYEGLLKHRYAGRTRPVLYDMGYIEGVAHIVRKWKLGFNRLATAGLMKYCFEQIIIDFPDIFTDPELQAKARANIASNRTVA